MKFLRQLRSLFRKDTFDTEMSEEMQAHVDLQAERNVAAGMKADDARYAALRQFGNVASIQQQARESRGWIWLEHLVRDFRFSLRSLRRASGFTATVVLTLALCIGAHTTVMSVLYGIIVKPMPFQNPGQLVEIYTWLSKSDAPKRATSVTQYRDYQAGADLFEGFALWQTWTFNIGEEADPERGIGARVTADYFTLLGVQPLLGRFYTMEECVPGRDKVLVLTQTYWEKKFNADPSVVGRVIRLSGDQFTIIGVAPRSMEALNNDTSLLKPFEWTAAQEAPQARLALKPKMYARVRSGVAHEAALAQLVTMEQRFYETAALPGQRNFRDINGANVRLGQVRAEQTKSVRASLILLQGGALVVLLLGCVNVANLMLARANARQTELAVRQALGAGRAALARQLLAEALLLAGLGAGLGFGFAWASLRFVNTYTTAIVREVQPIVLDGVLLGTSIFVTLLVAAMIALLPIVKTWRTNLLASMQGGARAASSGAGMRAMSGILVTGQIALALVLLIGACLLFRSFFRVIAVDPGFDADRVVQGRTVFGSPGNTPESVRSTHALIVERMAEIPGVEKVAYTSGFPVAAVTATQAFPIRGMTGGADGTLPTATIMPVSPGYFEVMGIRLLEGRGFTADDIRPQARRVFVVDQNFARKYFAGRSPVGEFFGFGSNLPPEQWPMIVGVVAPAKLGGLEDSSGTPFVFTPIGPLPGFSLLLRTSQPASVVVPLMRAKLRSVDPAAPLYISGSLRENFDWLLTNRRGIMALLGAFAATALLLSAVGIYGMLAYDVTQRTREIGIRGAIGASRGQILRLILGQGMRKTAAGLGLGLVGALGLNRYLETQLFEVKPTDPLTFVCVTAGLTLIAFLACWLPARRAGKVDPVIALRAE